jgi:predicted lactoylglutathione lyase
MRPDTIFVNLPVKDLKRSVAFYASLGFTPHPIFQSETASCLCISDHINLMLQTVANFQQFTSSPIADPTQTTGVLLCLHCDSPQQVDDLVAAALSAGATTPDSAQDLGFLYTHGFTDPDGYLWKLNHIYPNGPLAHP